MDGAPYRLEICGGTRTDSIEMSGTLLDLINSLPDSVEGNPGKTWTREEDEALLAGWGKKRQTEVAEILGVSLNTCRKRYRKLTHV